MDKPYKHWTTFVRQHANKDPEALLPFVAFPPSIPTEGEQCMAEQLKYVEEATVLTDRDGAESLYDAESGDWFDEQ